MCEVFVIQVASGSLKAAMRLLSRLRLITSRTCCFSIQGWSNVKGIVAPRCAGWVAAPEGHRGGGGFVGRLGKGGRRVA